MDLLNSLKEKAKNHPKKIVLPESFDVRVLHAADMILKEGLAEIILLGEEKDIFSKAEGLNLKNIKKARIITPQKSEYLEHLVNAYYNMRKYKSISRQQAREDLMEPVYFAALMLRENLADGFVAGASVTSRNVVKAAIQGVGVDKNIQTVSSSFLMLIPDCALGEKGVFMFADCGVIPSPSVKQLANIAVSTAQLFKQLVGTEPKVAMLSYSSHGSGLGEDVEIMRQATELVRQMSPELIMDGELQVDAAIVPEVAKIKVPGTKLAGNANILVFPNLAAGNISYKLVQRLCGARAIGPILQGLTKPCGDLSRGCNIQDIIDAVMINVVRAQG